MKKEFLEYKKAKKIIHKLKIPSKNEFYKLARSDKLPKEISKEPRGTYVKQGTWVTWGDFLGTGTIGTQKRISYSYDEAKKIIHKLKIPSKNEFYKLARSDKLPKEISKEPRGTYVKQGTWVTWGDFLGTGTIGTQTISKNYLPLDEARKKARELAKKYNIKTWNDWNKAVKEGLIPDNIPMQPDRVYSKKRKK